MSFVEFLLETRISVLRLVKLRLNLLHFLRQNFDLILVFLRYRLDILGTFVKDTILDLDYVIAWITISRYCKDFERGDTSNSLLRDSGVSFERASSCFKFSNSAILLARVPSRVLHFVLNTSISAVCSLHFLLNSMIFVAATSLDLPKVIGSCDFVMLSFVIRSFSSVSSSARRKQPFSAVKSYFTTDLSRNHTSLEPKIYLSASRLLVAGKRSDTHVLHTHPDTITQVRI